MRQVTTRQIQQNTKQVRERLELGESLEWVSRGQVIALLTPVTRRIPTAEWTDPMARLYAIYGVRQQVKKMDRQIDEG